MPPVLPAPQPTKIFFDPFNSSSTGHQRAENRLSGSTSWRSSRQHKLASQFRDTSGRGGEVHVADLVGAGSELFGKDGRKDNGDWEVGASGLREEGWQDIGRMFGKRKALDEDDEECDGKRRKVDVEGDIHRPLPFSVSKRDTAQNSSTFRDSKDDKSPISEHDSSRTSKPDPETAPATTPLSKPDPDKAKEANPPQIFKGLTIFLNGTTMPLISDHRLKHLFVQHGGSISLSLARKSITHVILGSGAGGGLASGKIQKENSTVRGKGVRYVGVKWVLDSIERGVRRAESQYACGEVRGRLGGAGQKRISDVVKKRSG